MEQLVLKATKRTETGKAFSKQLRATGKLPAIMYNTKGEAGMLIVDELEFTKVWKQATATTLICLDVEGTKYQAFIKDTEYDIIANRNLHVDFHVIDEKSKIRANIKIQTTGTPIGVREGGFLVCNATTIKVECLPKDLPVRIVADIDPLAVGHTFCVKDIKLDKSVKILSNPEAVIAAVHPAR